MYGVIEVYGIIIKCAPIGEYDKRITLLTNTRGKISAFARGARRQGSPLMGATNVFASGTFKLFEGRDSYTLQTASVDSYFSGLLEDMETTCYGTYFLELADYYAREYVNEPEMLVLLYLTLKALSKPGIPRKLVRRIYELRLMVINGEYDPRPSLEAGEACEYAWDFIINTPLKKLYSFVVTDEVYEQLARNIDAMMNRFLDKKMNSLVVLEAMTE
jgi:DNA repair protein RecO (recombination protein O)